MGAAVASGEEGFSQLAVRCDPRVPFATLLHVRRHRPAPADDGEGDEATRSERTVFVVGVSPVWGEAEVRAIFERFGDVETVAAHQKKSSCLVVFTDGDGADTLLRHAATPGQVVEVDLSELDGDDDGGDGDEEGAGGGGGGEPVGLRAWVAAHRALRPGREALQQQLDDWMTAFDQAEAEAEAARLAAEAEDDGWTVVGAHKGRKKTTSQSGVVVGGVSAAAAERKRGKQAKQQTDFYRFQQREQRRSELLNLRKKFEEDKKKIAQLKASRKFKPY